MKIAIVYATTEGQTRKIVRFAADHLAGRGVTVELLRAADAQDLDLARFDAAIVAASVHLNAYQAEIREFARAHAAGLSALPTLFLSVSLAAAGDDADDWQGLARIVAGFARETGWTPARVEHVAGAFRFGEYDFFRAWAMRWIAAQKGQTVDRHGDTEYTDWAALERALDDWLGGLS
jgi:menaquinone-dependent protoporphyrinogen oxidase